MEVLLLGVMPYSTWFLLLLAVSYVMYTVNINSIKISQHIIYSITGNSHTQLITNYIKICLWQYSMQVSGLTYMYIHNP